MGDTLALPSEAALKRASTLLPRVLEEEAQNDPHRIIAMFAKSSDISQGFDTVTAQECLQAVDFTAHWLDTHLSNYPSGETIAYIGIQDFRYPIIEFAAMKTRYPLLLPGPRNALVNTISLMEATNCTRLFYAAQYRDLASSLIKSIASLEAFEVPSTEEMIRGYDKPYPFEKTWEKNKNDVVLVLHTSGSTGAPKPIPCTHSFINCFCYLPMMTPEVPGYVRSDIRRLEKGKMLFTPSAFIHMSGVVFGFTTILSGITLVCGPPEVPCNGKIMHDVFKRLPIHGVIAAPSILESLFLEHGEDLKSEISNLGHVCWLGAPLSPAVGDYIVGLPAPRPHLWQIFGSTETATSPLLIPPIPSLWSYIKYHPQLAPDFEEIEPGSNLYEVVFNKKADPALSWTQPVFQLRPDLTQWRTRDVLRKYDGPLPDGVGPLWKFERRVDDLINLSNSLHVNPVHVELALQSHPLLTGCLVFGEGRTRCGVLLETKDDVSMGDEELVKRLWGEVEKANQGVPEHARIIRPLVLVVKKDRKLPRAAKQSIIRSLSLKEYEQEIDEAYKRLEKDEHNPDL